MSMEQITQLRNATGAGILDVKKALDEAGGDYDKAMDIIRKRGAAVALKKAGRVASEGVITSYIHQERIGVLLEVNCETDFVARTDEYKAFAKDLAMQIASMQPEYVSEEDVPADVVAKEREIYKEQIEGNKPVDVVEKILDGKIQKYYDETCLMRQKFFKNEDQTIQELVQETIGKMGENIQIRRFVRFSLDDNHAAGQSC